MWPFKKKKSTRIRDSNPRCISLLEDIECTRVSVSSNDHQEAAFFTHLPGGGVKVFLSLAGPELDEIGAYPGKYRVHIMLWPVP